MLQKNRRELSKANLGGNYMRTTIALAGNPNSGKTTLFNLLTGANQFVGNWPGVTVEKKEGKLKKHSDITIADLPGIYSLSPYSPEEMVARSFLTKEKPQAIINIVDGTNLERNLFLTTQLMELGIPMVLAVNMMDEVDKAGDKIDEKKLSEALGCPVVMISALKNKGIDTLIETAVKQAKEGGSQKALPFSVRIENAVSELEKLVPGASRWHMIKLLETDEEAVKDLQWNAADKEKARALIESIEKDMDDEMGSILTSQRYESIAKLIKNSYVKKNKNRLSKSDKIDKIITNRFLALPIFVVVMFLVYHIAVTTVGTWVTDWTNDGLFGDGYFFLGKGRAAFDEASEEFAQAETRVAAFEEAAKEKGFELIEGKEDEFLTQAKDVKATAVYEDEDGNETGRDEVDLALYQKSKAAEEPEPEKFGPWVKGVPVLVEGWLENSNIADWLKSLIIDGIIAGVGAVLGFVPQMFVLFLMLAILESCGYMARIAFIMDRIFRKFGLSGKSFIPVMIGTGCSVPGIMASRTIENVRDRRMTIMTTSFMPCGAKLPVIAMIAGALFNQSTWVSTGSYFLGIAAIIVSGIILKKTKRFAGDPAPFVMELPAYRLPRPVNVLRSMWERGWSFIKKAGTIILLSSIFIWFISKYGIVDGKFAEVGGDLVGSFAQRIGNVFAFIFKPLGFGNWQNSVATVMGLVAKENVVSTFGILYGFEEVSEKGREIWALLANDFTSVSALSFLAFNLLCAPCFAAIGAIKREMNSFGWTSFALFYQTVLAWVVALIVYQLGGLVMGIVSFNVFTVVALFCLTGLVYLMLRPDPEKALRKAGK